jgi:hypothetical protein
MAQDPNLLEQIKNSKENPNQGLVPDQNLRPFFLNEPISIKGNVLYHVYYAH